VRERGARPRPREPTDSLASRPLDRVSEEPRGIGHTPHTVPIWLAVRGCDELRTYRPLGRPKVASGVNTVDMVWIVLGT
jgi:hypothetical protein